jgi:hypothetical protein
MPSSRFLISSQTLASSAASVTFSSIPATYTDLVLRISARTNASGSVNDSIEITFNGDTASNYSTRIVAGSGSAAFSDQYSNNTPSRAWYGATGNSATANTFGSTEVYIPNYLVSQNKQISIFGLNETNATAATMAAVASLWRNTAAITSILLDPLDGSATFNSGSSFYLYGLKNS